MINHLARIWEHCFGKYLPDNVVELMSDLTTYLGFFEAEMQGRSALKKSTSYEYAMGQISLLKANLEDASSLIEVIKNQHRRANRKFVPAIASAMTPAYERCRLETGE
jgi:hypothetical protein